MNSSPREVKEVMVTMPAVEEKSPLMKVAEVCKVTQKGEVAIRRAIELGQIPSVRLGRKVLVPRRPLMKLLGLSD